ncbi:NADPH-dependent FMN reductase [Reinekea blandensis]|uniref:FMN reductase, NADPH-dependent n=1 Tax=Reinekea blandensis MED297 TaxID=314283 RepID=A4B8Z6_9GAMM|nr:NAD(P)H-dependent oxidoreductase [Reinekea blandensis]EAR11097.1 FMN reductase, NADPH-dependent [Reinekea sp. MED297] [Reinekea blandensis MED297]
MNILAFAASNSTTSINQQLALWSGRQIAKADVSTLDLNDYELPIYSEAREQAMGTPEQVLQFLSRIKSADLIIIGFAEHNGTFTAAWKNLLDWVTRTEREFFGQTAVLALATSPGAGGARSVLQQASQSLPFFGAEVIDTISVPQFMDVFDPDRQELRHGSARTQILNALAQVSLNTQAKETVDA